MADGKVTVVGRITVICNGETVGDEGAKVILFPENDRVREYDNSLAAMRIAGKYDSGIVVAVCDKDGLFDAALPDGDYTYLIISHARIGNSRFSDSGRWYRHIRLSVGRFLSETDLHTLSLFMGYQAFTTGRVSVKDGGVQNVGYCFG